MARYIGIDVGAEAIKVVELEKEGAALRWTRRAAVEHHKEPGQALRTLLAGWGWDEVDGAAVTGRLGRPVALMRVPAKQAQAAGYRFLHGAAPATVVSIGSHGFSVLELREGAIEVFRENSRCAQGTGNFLRQLVERFDLDVESAARMAAGVADPAPLSGRCPVILKTDMTHLANKGESKDRILAGLLDAIAENVQVLVKPRVCPDRLLVAGGVARSARVRDHFRKFAERQGMTFVDLPGDDGLYLDALGCAVAASEHGFRRPALEDLVEPPLETSLERLPALATALPRVRRMPAGKAREWEGPRDVVLGFDIGSTGSKAVALDLEWKEPLWEGYLRTNGDPIGAAQALMKEFLASPAALHRVRGFGATGSGREIVGSLLSTCFGCDTVYVLNEIAAHATGALHFEPRVDTIFEIGGQDAKYIRLAEGRVIDAAMNEACSAGTGSFIEEQGKRFQGIDNVVQLGAEALGAPEGVALGQHCSIFMAEIIDEAVAGGVPRERIIAGIYDSVISNYLNRVKGSRSVGQVIFCQGQPFASDALAAAVARQTGAEVIVPPKPGLMGAIGIALLAAEDLATAAQAPIEAARFLGARIEKKDNFVCTSTQGCGGAGNKCRIDRLTTVVEGEKQRFTWGGNCSLYDRGTRKKKLPDLSPDPFRERALLVQRLVDEVSVRRGLPVVAITDEFQLKGLFPFYATFLHRLGFDLAVSTGADRKALKRGIEEGNVPFCAPMQQYHGLVASMADQKPDWLFLPMLREIPRVARERTSQVCPIVQAAPDMLRWDLGQEMGARVLSPVVDMGPGFLDSEAFLKGCGWLAEKLGVKDWRAAWTEARDAQRRFDDAVLASGQRALDFCREQGVTPVVVLGRAYTIHNDVLNSNVPSILREQGAIAIPVDAFPVPDDAPIFDDMFWGYSQRILRAAWHIRRTPGLYSIFCSNYSCGPDSFTVHSFAWLMEGRPLAIIETDGHAGDAGTKTRVEAFLHCVREDQRATRAGAAPDPAGLYVSPQTIGQIAAARHRVLIPPMGPEAEALAAALRGLKVPAEVMEMPTRDTLRIGRRHTSGKECLPLTVTLGSVLERIEAQKDSLDKFVFFMPGSDGPCRFGAYRQLHKLILDRLGWGDRVTIWSPPFGDYFQGLPPGFAAIAYVGFCALGALNEALHDVRPVETRTGAAEEIHARGTRRIAQLVEQATAGDLSGARVLLEATTSRLWGIPAAIRETCRELAEVKSRREVPNVLVVGEIYVRCDPFSNDFITRQLERRGIRARVEPVSEFIQYSDYIAWKRGWKKGLGDRIDQFVRNRISAVTHHAMTGPLGLPEAPSIEEAVEAGSPYVRDQVEVETLLTIGVPVRAWRRKEIDAVVSVGPLECMPNKIAEAQFCHVAEEEGLLSLTLSLNGDPVDPETLDNFAFEVHQRFRRARERATAPAQGVATPGLAPAAAQG
ncbi:MAG: acyl-CoA dehydratase activase-related protein [Anaeromyxobacteraceae bacterium]|nr:acyl-CoA dehydratase activase-related protein [Anaeromyxobacteraceae bacterium]